MRSHRSSFSWLPLIFCLAAITSAQQVASPTGAVVPTLVNFSGMVRDIDGKPLNKILGVTFSLYEDSEGSAPLWVETQNVQPDEDGHYSVMLGSTTSQGLPAELFSTGEARWLGIRVEGQDEQPRVLLLSVPYALKAADAQTLGGLPASAFALAQTAPGAVKPQPAFSSSAPVTAAPPITSKGVTTTGGTAQNLAIFTSATNIQNSIAQQIGTTAIDVTGRVGVNTAAPSQSLDVTSGDAIIRGIGNFAKTGDTATLWIGDTHHPIEAIWDSGLAIGAFKAPTAIFVADFTGNVGIGTTTPTTAILNTVATSPSVIGLSVSGFSAPTSSNLSASDGLHVSGGNGDSSAAQLGANVGGGNGIVVAGGAGGTNFNGAPLGGNGGNALVANGGNSGPDGATGGAGLVATGGEGIAIASVGGPGGVFMGSSGNIGAGAGATFTGGVCGGGSCAAADGIDATTDGPGGYAGNFTGNINVTGAIFAGTKDFKIDHPLDPANKYLLHASVESSEMMNIYTGNVSTNGAGEATVILPDWFEALNTDFRYQLTVIGQFAQAIVGQEIQNNQFTIRTNLPNIKVSWQITAVRHDAYAKAHPLVVEEQKSPKMRGYYIHPELYGAPEEKGIEWVRNPTWMKQAQAQRAKAGLAMQSATQRVTRETR